MKRTYPLRWPEGWPRTYSALRRRSIFSKPDLRHAQAQLLKELQKLGAGVDNARLALNLDLTIAGELRVEQQRALDAGRQPSDPGAAIYFTLKGKEHVLACDRWERVEDNVHALGKHISTIRAQERYGVGTLEQAFRGYAALAAPPTWWEILGVQEQASPTEIDEAFQRLSLEGHPDRGGSADIGRLKAARDEGRRARGAA